MLLSTAFAFFADKHMQSFYKRFIRDYVRYKDSIQCVGHQLVRAVREDAARISPESNGTYYALHIRRGDLQFKVSDRRRISAMLDRPAFELYWRACGTRS